MKKIFIIMIFMILTVIVSCENSHNVLTGDLEIIEDMDYSDDFFVESDLNENENDVDSDSGNTGDDGDAGNTCIYGEIRRVTCTADKAMEQKQVCNGDEWDDWGGCICPETNNFCYNNDGLSWSDPSNVYMVWAEAVTYCETLGGRLPTISELRTQMIKCPKTETGGECGVTDDCLSYDCFNSITCGGCSGDDTIESFSVFGFSYLLWSSSELPIDSNNAWGIHFRDGSIRLKDKAVDKAFAQCVKK